MKDLKKYYADIVITIDALQAIAGSFTVRDLDDTAKRWTVERGLAIIGEAAYQISRIDQAAPITNLSSITGMRHIIIHEYDRLDNAQLIAVIQRHLGLLREEAQHILDSLS